ncbi:MAG: topoisomerase C-terminal repeat-containing protein [Myxococcales bacterium]|nr:topoisomerase C-terminal repeat-containing protein [Myxococcales bacterium]
MIAEKPSVARDLARVLGVAPKGKTHFEGTTHVITWCIGHLVSLAEPAAHDSAWKTWRLDALPMIPPRFRLAARTNAPEQLRAVRDLLQDRRRFRSVVNACDAGREGELIFRYVYELSGSALPIERLWVSSLTDEAITKGFARLEPGSKYDRLADAARCRDEADWLVGLNATRAVTARAQTVGERKVYSLGRVQTPTLALVVTRDEAIKNFVAKDYWQVQGAFVTARGQKFDAQWTHATGARLATESLANALCGRCATAARTETQRPIVESVATKRTREPPPMLFDLTSLQRTANKRFGFSAQRTLDLAQALYERHKALTYPRTDSRHLPRDMHGEMATVLASLSSIADYAPFADAISSPPPMPRRMFDDAQVSDHHAIIPTGRKVDPNALAPDERRLYDLVARRFLAGFFADAEFDDTTVVVRVGAAGASVPALSTIAPPIVKGAKPDASAKEEPKILEALPPPPDRFVARGRVRIEAGWQTVAGIDADEDSSAKGRAPASAEGESADDNERTQMLPKLVQGEPLDARYDAKKKQTRPPPRYSEATLLSAMESAGKSLEDDALRAAMRERGLGTPATRASTIETLIDRGYARRDRRNIVATPLGTALIKSLPVAELASAELTGEWEARLSRIERGEESRASFMNDIGAFVRASIDAVKKAPISLTSDTTATAQPIGRCPRCGNTVVDRTGDYGCALGPGPCGLSIPKKIANRLISPELAAVLLRAKKTVILRGFKSRAGKSFAASLVLGDDGKITFEFESGARTTGETASNEGPPRPAPLRRERATLSAARDAAKEPPRPRAPAPTATSPKRAPTPEATERAALERAANLEVLETLTCPRCKSGRIVQGNRGWGCARWKDGCAFVVWFETAGRKLTVSQLAQLVAKGRTRSGVFRPGNGPPLKGKLVLDLDAKGGSAKFEASAEADP